MNITSFLSDYARTSENKESAIRRALRPFLGRPSKPSITPLENVRSVSDLHPVPVVYERTAFMDHIRRYDREALRQHYLRQPIVCAEVWANYAVNLWEYEHGVETLTSHPWNIAIPMTEVCNALCTFCSSPLVPNPKTL